MELPTFGGSGVLAGVDLTSNAALAEGWTPARLSMRCVDVNLLVYAHRSDVPNPHRFRQWLEESRRADEPLGLSTLVLSGFLRIVTHPRVFRVPTRTGKY